MYKRVAVACSIANPQYILQRRDKRAENAETPYLPITSRFSVFEGDIHATEVCAVMNVVKSRNHCAEHDLGTAVARKIDHHLNSIHIHTYHLSILLPCFSEMRKANFPRSAENL